MWWTTFIKNHKKYQLKTKKSDVKVKDAAFETTTQIDIVNLTQIHSYITFPNIVTACVEQIQEIRYKLMEKSKK